LTPEARAAWSAGQHDDLVLALLLCVFGVVAW
jgi:hypothetical protein